jgi:PAS domain S-box-containing protein
METKSVSEDSSERKLSLKELLKFKSAVEHSPSTVVITDIDGNIEYVNPQFSVITGYTFDEVKGEKTNIFNSGYHSADFYNNLWYTIKSGKTWRGEFRNKKKNGELYWESASIAPIIDENGNISDFVAIKEDITQQKIAEQALVQNEEKYRKIFEQFHDLYFKTNLQGIILELGPAVFELTGYTSEELLGKSVSDIYYNAPDRINFINKLLKDKVIINYELKFITKHGDIIDTDVSAHFEFDDKGNPEYIAGTIHDITKLKRIEKELKELNVTKEKFFSIIAHDLKNPIGSFKQLTKLLNDEFEQFSQDEKKEIISLLNSSASQLFQLLENLLTWSSSQMNKISFNPEKTDICQIIKNNISLLTTQAQNKNITLNNKCESNIIGFFDVNMISTVIRNLISNAIKFTPSGGNIIISSEYFNGNIKIWVTDSGIGISENDIQKLFKIESSHSTPGTENESGTGLGLILCKEFVQKNGGEIWVKSELNKGTTFFFTLPAATED